jgi:hypothetical protein
METTDINNTTSGTTEPAEKNLVVDIDLNQKQLPAHEYGEGEEQDTTEIDEEDLEEVEEEEKPIRTVGRPTDFSQEMVDKAWEYIDSCKDEEVQEIKQESEEKGYVMYDNKLKVKIPTVGGLARYLRVARSTIYLWGEKHPEFSDIIEILGAEQEDRLINKGLGGDYNPTISKVLLSKHGYREKIDQDLTSGGKPIPIYGGQSVQNSGHDSDKKDIQPEEKNQGS